LKSKLIQKFQETEIGIIPKHWEIKELQKISKVIDSAHITPEYSSNGFSMVRVKDIKSGFLDLKKSFKVSKKIYDEFTKNHKPRKNDIVMGRVGTYGIASFVYTDETFCLGQNTVVIHSPISRFIYYALNSKVVKNQIEENVVGSTQKTISLANIRKLLIAIPSTPKEIEKIEKILFDLDLKISTLETQNQTLEKIIQLIFQSWFVDFDGQTEFVDSELGKIPKDWEVRKFGDVIKLEYGKSLTKNNRKPGIFPVYGSSGIVGFHNEAIVKGPGIIIGRKGNVGSLYWSDDDFFPIDTVFFVKTKIPLHYIFHNLKKQKFINSDSSVPGLQRDQAYNLLILVPPVELSLKFEKFSKNFKKQVIENEIKINSLSLIKDSLLPKLMSGEILLKNSL